MHMEASFEAIDVLPSNLETWVKSQFRPDFLGAAVTIPHKETIREFLDFESEAATNIGAVNTLFWEKGALGGTNTDIIGILRAVSTEMNPEDEKVLVLGAGGSARAAIFGLKSAGADVFIWNRTKRKAEELASEFSIEVIQDLDEIDPEMFSLVMNMTSVGLKEPKSIVPKSFWKPCHTAFDAVYDPLETKFLFDAEKAGAQTITGDKMLVYQAIEQFRIWHDIELEPEIMGSAFFL